MITYILPSAGKGARLGLPYPKEIHRVLPDKSLIDFSLAHTTAEPGLTEKVVVVLGPGKEIVADYAESVLPKTIPLRRARFNPEYHEWPGSIRSAEALFGEYNVALLPDSVLTPEAGDVLAARYRREFEDGADLVFAYMSASDTEQLQRLGALKVALGEVTAFCDKPDVEFAGAYNAFWASFGFRKACGADVLSLMMRSVAREPVNLGELGLTVRAFPVADYVDLGTWPSLAKYLGSEKLTPKL